MKTGSRLGDRRHGGLQADQSPLTVLDAPDGMEKELGVAPLSIAQLTLVDAARQDHNSRRDLSRIQLGRFEAIKCDFFFRELAHGICFSLKSPVAVDVAQVFGKEDGESVCITLPQSFPASSLGR